MSALIQTLTQTHCIHRHTYPRKNTHTGTNTGPSEEDPAVAVAAEAARKAAAPFKRHRPGCTLTKAAKAATKAWKVRAVNVVMP